jgi:hypothetical protein
MSKEPAIALLGRALSATVSMAVLLVLLLTTASAQDSAEWARFNVDIELLPTGEMAIRETQEFKFTGGPFSSAFRAIPLDRVDGIADVRVSERTNEGQTSYQEVPSDFTGDAGTYHVVESATELQIEWGFEPTTDRSRTFVIDYLVLGGVRNYPDETPPYQQIWWAAIPEEITRAAPVRDASATIRLPVEFEPAQVVAGTENLPIEPIQLDARTWQWVAGALRAGDDLTVLLQFPPIAGVSTPSWQAEADLARATESALATPQPSTPQPVTPVPQPTSECSSLAEYQKAVAAVFDEFGQADGMMELGRPDEFQRMSASELEILANEAESIAERLDDIKAPPVATDYHLALVGHYTIFTNMFRDMAHLGPVYGAVAYVHIVNENIATLNDSAARLQDTCPGIELVTLDLAEATPSAFAGSEATAAPSSPGRAELKDVRDALVAQGLEVDYGREVAHVEGLTIVGQQLFADDVPVYVFLFGSEAERATVTEGIDVEHLVLLDPLGDPIESGPLVATANSNVLAVSVGASEELQVKIDAGIESLP